MNKTDTKTSLSNTFSNTLNRISNKSYFFLLILSILIQLFRYRSNLFIPLVNEWSTQELTFNYSYGFIRRGLLGTFTQLIQNAFHIEFLSAVVIVQNLGFILFLVSFLLFISKLLKDDQDKTFCFIVLVTIGLNLFGFELKMFGLFDTYIMAITMLMIYLIITDRALFLIPFLAGICVLIHEGYPMMYFGVIVALLVYRFCYSDNYKAMLKYSAVFISTGLVVSGLFIYFYFIHPRINDPDIEAILANSKKLLNAPSIDTSNLRFIWLDDEIIPNTNAAINNMCINGKLTDWFFKLIRIPIMNAVVCSPLIYLTSLFWIRVIKGEKTKYKKAILFLCGASVLLTLPIIILHTDQARWFYDIFFFEITVIGTIYLLNLNNERCILQKICRITLPKVLLVVLYLVFYWRQYITFISYYLLPLVFGWEALLM